jgi:hypothetical protein
MFILIGPHVRPFGDGNQTVLQWPQVRRQRSSEVSCSSQNDGWQLKSERFQLHVWRHCLTIVGTMDRKSFNTDMVWRLEILDSARCRVAKFDFRLEVRNLG